MQLAVHIGNQDQADALFELTSATADVNDVDRQRLAELYRFVRDVTGRPDLVGRDVSNEVERRKREAQGLTTEPGVRQRIGAAPRGYVLTQHPAVLARHAQLCEPPPARDDVRVVVHPDDEGFRVDVVAADRVGLIARTTWALFESNCSVAHAVAATWGDGTALASYQVSAASAPDPDGLGARLRALLDERLSAPPSPGVRLEFDDDGSPWHTRCTARGADRPGLLHALTTSFAIASVNVHAARAATNGAQIIDTFDLTTRHGNKLDEATKRRVAETLRCGIQPARRRFWPRRRMAHAFEWRLASPG
jgi:[protein-PII] uridylyltransferase